MDGEPDPAREVTRVPTDADLVSLARELNRLGVVDLMTEACGVRYEDAVGGIETELIDGVAIPFAGAELMLRMKQSLREKDATDRSFLQQLIRARRA